jgi:UDP-sulfoquinovose synthase
MRVLVAGIDGYLGWGLAQHLARRGHVVAGIDNGARRRWVEEMGGESVIPIASRVERIEAFRDAFGVELRWQSGDLCDYATVRDLFESVRPECIVHLAEMPSAPYSMMDVQHAVYTHQNNLVGTLIVLYAMRDVCPDAHLLKLGTMGEYGTPPLDIPEGDFEIEFRGKRATVMFPRNPGSMYHLTKVHDTHNIRFACRMWGLRSTDIMQGVVFGTRIDAMGDDHRLRTRFDCDQAFGTAINRFCAQAVGGLPITPYGKGGQKRGFLPLRDSIQCFTLALENPPQPGEYRVFNQFEECYTVGELAERVQSVARRQGLDAVVQSTENPRIELEEHEYRPDHQKLLDLGYVPTHDLEAEIAVALNDLLPHRARVLAHRKALTPDIRWDGQRRTSRAL